ncbi:MAG: hypothetical protein JWP69_1521 [Flaviaesturariibacter sp.]|nr:hypothetical protein [Flaviaesturariibacter sp.]
MAFVCSNGLFVNADQPVLLASNRGLKYGDGVFETMRLHNGRLLLEELHFKRLFQGLQLLQINATHLQKELLVKCIMDLCVRNNCLASARVRLAVYREAESSGFLIEANTIEPFRWNETGYTVDIFPTARKSCDHYANLKSANYLPYVMADRYANEKGLDESLVLNVFGNICDGSKTNLFIIHNGELMTPALEQGCIAGVMRENIINRLGSCGVTVHQTSLTIEHLLAADAVFLSNAIRGIQWVANFKQATYKHEKVREVYAQVFPSSSSTLYSD